MGRIIRKLAPAAFQKSIRYSQVFHNIEEKHFEALNQTEKKKEQKTNFFLYKKETDRNLIVNISIKCYSIHNV